MKPYKLEDYMNLSYKLEIIKDTEDNSYVASYPELPGCLSSGNTIAEAIHNIEDAKENWLMAAMEDNIDIPLPETANKYSGQFKLRMPKTLHRLLAQRAKAEGISMNQYCIYSLSKDLQYKM